MKSYLKTIMMIKWQQMRINILLSYFQNNKYNRFQKTKNKAMEMVKVLTQDRLYQTLWVGGQIKVVKEMILIIMTMNLMKKYKKLLECH